MCDRMSLDFKITRLGVGTGDRIERKFVSSGCSDLDSILGGGFAFGEVTELFGPPGSGRTQLALTACANAVVSGGAALYVDADGSVVPARVRELVKVALASQNAVASFSNKPAASIEVGNMSDAFTEAVDAILAKFMVCRAMSWEEVAIGVAHKLRTIIEQRKDVSVVVIDSVSLPYRNFYGGRAQKGLEIFACRLMSLAVMHGVAVLLVNNAREVEHLQGMASPYEQSYQAAIANEVGIAAMGEAWAHVCPCRMGLGWRQRDIRVAHLVKSSRMPRASALFDITSAGVSDELRDEFRAL